jgi:NAD(P)-dependent dehydrogenase (short-subunit alcohol dehydrogenase family)
MGETLQVKTVVVVGQGGGIARGVTVSARSEGAQVVVAGRDKARPAAAHHDTGINAEFVDVNNDSSIAALAERVGLVDHVVSAVSARARGRVDQLERVSLLKSFDTTVVGPLTLTKYFTAQINRGGSFVLFSGFPAFKINVGFLGVAITDGAVDAALFAMKNTFVTGVTLKVDGGQHLT